MTDPRKPAATVEKNVATKTGGRRLIIRNQDGTTQTVITSPSSTAAIIRAARTYRRALKELADE